jgi:hypothetical protein
LGRILAKRQNELILEFSTKSMSSDFRAAGDPGSLDRFFGWIHPIDVIAPGLDPGLTGESSIRGW